MSRGGVLDRLEPPSLEAGTEPVWLFDARMAAWEWLQTNGLPTQRDEAWRDTPLGDLLATTPRLAPLPEGVVEPTLIDRLAGDHGRPRLVVVNGFLVPELSDIADCHAGLHCGPVSSLLAESPAIRAALSRAPGGARLDGFDALNQASGPDGAVIVVDPGIQVASPVHVVHLVIPGGEPIVSQPRTLVEVGEASEITIIETFVGTPGPALINAVTSVDVGVDAVVRHYVVQAQASGATHLGHTSITQASGSDMRSCSITLGADVARYAVDVTVDGPEVQTELAGLYLTTGAQRHETVTTVDHAASRGTSSQQFRGVVGDHARGCFSGRIIVRPGTMATDANQTTRSLVLDPTAQADARPWLEIFADDVRCTHGAAVGRLDDEALFYLRSRGFSEADARVMLTGAFIAEIVDSIGPATLRSRVESAVAAKLSSMGDQG